MSSLPWTKAIAFLVLGFVLKSLGEVLTVMGDRAVEIHGLGNGKGGPFYLLALGLTLASLIAYFIALRHVWRFVKAHWDKSGRP